MTTIYVLCNGPEPLKGLLDEDYNPGRVAMLLQEAAGSIASSPTGGPPEFEWGEFPNSDGFTMSAQLGPYNVMSITGIDIEDWTEDPDSDQVFVYRGTVPKDSGLHLSGYDDAVVWVMTKHSDATRWLIEQDMKHPWRYTGFAAEATGDDRDPRNLIKWTMMVDQHA